MLLYSGPYNNGQWVVMIRINLTADEHERLRHIHTHHEHPVVRLRALVILLRDDEKNCNESISKVTDLCTTTITTYVRQFREGGMGWVISLNFRKPVSQLHSFEETIKRHFSDHPVSTVAQACEQIRLLTGIVLKKTQVRCYLKKLGLNWRKVGSIPGKIDIEAQQDFHDNKLQPRLAEAKEGKRTVYFVDAAHFVMGAFEGYLWSSKRIFVKTPSGRKRWNVLGALNATTQELEMVTNDTYITSTQVCELLRKIAAKKTGPITLVLDNARYQRCKLVTDLAAALEIELLFLPPYSPNLNLIERLWKLTRKECLNSKYYALFTEFKDALNNFLSTMHLTHKEKLQSLLTLKFQLYTQEQIVEKAA